MTEIPVDMRVISEDAPQYNATLIRREDHSAELASFWVRLDGDAVPFEAGQYMTAGVFADGKLWQRPYSVASAPAVAGTEGYELYVRLVPVIRFTTLLWRLREGARMRLIGPKGRFMLEPDDHRTHLYVSTGTGIAPFLGMIRQTQRVGNPRRTVVLHGVSFAEELGYRDVLEAMERDGTYPLRYVPTVSRPHDPRNAGWTGRTGRVEAVVDRGLPRPAPVRRPDGRLHLRQSRDDPQRRGRPHAARLPGVPRQEGALLAEGQGARRPDGGRRELTRLPLPGATWSPAGWP